MPNPDKKFVFVLGGARSGKSGLALKLAEGFPGPRAYIATAEALDSEMEERINNHKKDRGADWTTVEEPKDIEAKVDGLKDCGVILIDCLTLWLTNLIEAGLSDAVIKEAAEKLAASCKRTEASVIAVSNELGLGIVPENPLSRRFRDLSGTINQLIANAAQEVFFVAAGIALKMK